MARPVQIPELNREVEMTPVSPMCLRSELKKENVLLTESIELVGKKEEKSGREKTKASTFMDSSSASLA